MRARLVVGIGCRRGVSADDIECAVRAALGNTLAFENIACVASIDAKRDEARLLAFGAQHGLPLRFLGAHDIASMPGALSPQALRHLKNVSGVCEPCALLASNGGRLVVGKIIMDGVTVAIARTSSNQHA